ncbi:MAG: thiamine pyrophosphate-binding protein [Alphaproteobacteria bacterium]|nr:thiamine pyrophosphate-binding protein [Alphaproteobacteria bacterium]MDP6255265.1 thiamine pyrophosphate-binding protein [Alphaproteobacteria bacterium]MDP7052833.1 thiamine pyrophosphate-binding protein [Alphaproteobacteria bacterium]MDP7229129.1 thiamine pyrophosphate-binding protein [Alphaproteobacteria bacterium]MDP7459645.1 thiamine pyrophosphate-binding protein [Alphaproteobacteria bacterium]
MRGRQVFMDSLAAHGVERIFGNPGTTESPLLDSLQSYPQIEYVVALHEGIAAGAASFYAQASGKIGVVNLHVAPGLGNAIGMMYGALKANSPMVVTAGQQDTRMRLRGPVLGYDLVAMAEPVTKWSVQVETADEIATIMQRAFKIANEAPAGPVFVSLPINVMEQDTEIAAMASVQVFDSPRPDPAGIAVMAEKIMAAQNPTIVVSDDVARARAHDDLVALTEAMGASVWFEGIRHHAAFPNRHPNAKAILPMDADAIRHTLGEADLVMLIGGPFFEEVWFTPGTPFPGGAAVLQVEETAGRMSHNHTVDAGLVGHLPTSLAALAKALNAARGYQVAAKARNEALASESEAATAAYQARSQRAWDRDPMSMARAMAELRVGTPDGTVVVEEAITAGLDLAQAFEFAAPGDYLSGRGGGIGQGLAGAIGAKVAQPDRPLLAVSGDGSAMYSIQALWSAAHHDLDIVFVILVNREYRILKHNLDTYRQRFDANSNQDYPQMNLDTPALDFVTMAKGMGMPGTVVSDPGQLAGAVKAAFAASGPHLISVNIEGKR